MDAGSKMLIQMDVVQLNAGIVVAKVTLLGGAHRAKRETIIGSRVRRWFPYECTGASYRGRGGVHNGTIKVRTLVDSGST